MGTNKSEFFVVSVDDTIKYGIIKAAIIGRVRHWCQYNEKHKVDNRHHINFWWSGFISSKVFAEQLGIKQRTIEEHLSNLLKDGVLVKGCFNKKNNDRTGWYRINPNPPTPELLSHNTGNASTLIREMDVRDNGICIYGNTGNGSTEIREMDLRNNGTPLPVSITDNNYVSKSVSPPVNTQVENMLRSITKQEFQILLHKKQTAGWNSLTSSECGRYYKLEEELKKHI